MLTLNGLISAQGILGTNSTGGGGGSGGGILIQCGQLSGNGTIRANGGAGNASGGGGGGGGRIAIYVTQGPLYTCGNISAAPQPSGGSGATAGAAGSIYLYFKPRGTMFTSW
jgi:hypothetical protein